MNTTEKYGAIYLEPGKEGFQRSRLTDLYTFYTYHNHRGVIQVEQGDSAIVLRADGAEWIPGPDTVQGSPFVCIIRGYQCGRKAASVDQGVNLPYVNGCATRQIFPPERVGDPTFQQLTIPPHTSEQVHHIHPTSRVVHVLEGEGYSIVGQSGECEETKLVPGMTIILHPMCPHHFRTEGKFLTVLPVHIFSSGPAGLDNNHPMWNGTKEV